MYSPNSPKQICLANLLLLLFCFGCSNAELESNQIDYPNRSRGQEETGNLDLSHEEDHSGPIHDLLSTEPGPESDAFNADILVDTDTHGTDGMNATDMSGDAPPCPYEGPPLIDPNIFPACTSCGGGHCVPGMLIPEELSESLAECDPGNLCVPDEYIETGGDFIPQTCRAVGDLEGRCLSTCLPDVLAMSDFLDRDLCPETHLCVPCYDPLSGSVETGACSISCDPGPTEEPTILSECCEGIGQCIPSSEIPVESRAQLGIDSCPAGEDLLCVPDVFIEEPDFQPEACVPLVLSLVFGAEYADGRCLPGCLPDVETLGFTLMQDGCNSGFLCVPCILPVLDIPTEVCE
jgi:hypothetical protein